MYRHELFIEHGKKAVLQVTLQVHYEGMITS